MRGAELSVPPPHAAAAPECWGRAEPRSPRLCFWRAGERSGRVGKWGGCFGFGFGAGKPGSQLAKPCGRGRSPGAGAARPVHPPGGAQSPPSPTFPAGPSMNQTAGVTNNVRCSGGKGPKVRPINCPVPPRLFPGSSPDPKPVALEQLSPPRGSIPPVLHFANLSIHPSLATPSSGLTAGFTPFRLRLREVPKRGCRERGCCGLVASVLDRSRLALLLLRG